MKIHKIILYQKFLIQVKVLSKYYGELEEDHEKVKYKIELYKQKYPNEKPKF